VKLFIIIELHGKCCYVMVVLHTSYPKKMLNYFLLINYLLFINIAQHGDLSSPKLRDWELLCYIMVVPA